MAKKRAFRVRGAQEPPPLVDIRELSKLTNVRIRSIRTFVAKRAIPFLKVGQRTLLFEPQKVLSALREFEIQAISPNRGRRK
jgi:hypothetical protein